MLSNYQKDLLTKLGMKEGSCTKLVSNLFDKKNYVVSNFATLPRIGDDAEENSPGTVFQAESLAKSLHRF